ncbi:hypothetical protein DQ04_06191050 [Trypanosoma grayi]|uniref:hypothetical protein n=1 Tax=Trypanosoma grayi TaxID=71804 RepID=UPI0004F43614|nr:hypothetical protein DQ04_06191050 [Trypanosoma grayi]KEG08916.1 hypothetical protein DQ04_06191050 [Trypanosoma grayi]
MGYLTSVLDCCIDFNICLDVCLCTSCQIGRQYAAVGGAPSTLSMKECAKGCMCPCIMATFLRRRISRKYSFRESPLSSCVLGFLCLQCGLCQTSRELILRESNPGGTCFEPTLVSVNKEGYDLGFLAPSVRTFV